MRRIFILLFAVVSLFAEGIVFETMSGKFVQTLASKQTKLTYTGDFYATKTAAFWHYKTPLEKKIYFSYKEVVILDGELEQAIVTKVGDVPNLSEILRGAAPNKNGEFTASLDGTRYTITAPKGVVKKISYTDKLDNRVTIDFTGVKKDVKLSPALFKAQIPAGFDIIKQ